MKPGSEVTLKIPPSTMMLLQAIHVSDVPIYGNTYTVSVIKELYLGIFYIGLEQMDPNNWYRMSLWKEVDELSNHTIESLLEEILEVQELVEVI